MVFARLSLAQEGESFIRPKSVYAPLRAALCSPYFLFRIEKDPPEGIAPINEYRAGEPALLFPVEQHAGRRAVRAGQGEPAARASGGAGSPHAQRPQGAALVENFAEQWLCLGALKSAAPDPKLFPDFDESLRKAMREETERFVRHVVRGRSQHHGVSGRGLHVSQ